VDDREYMPYEWGGIQKRPNKTQSIINWNDGLERSKSFKKDVHAYR
jgi:hypothetical protein